MLFFLHTDHFVFCEPKIKVMDLVNVLISALEKFGAGGCEPPDFDGVKFSVTGVVALYRMTFVHLIPVFIVSLL